MLLLIIGQNAIGKSVYIKNEANKALKNNKDVLFNGWDRKYLNNKNTMKLDWKRCMKFLMLMK